MINVRLVYEQIEVAREHVLSGSLLGSRLALILLDNVAELLMHRDLQWRFGFDESLLPKWEPARSEMIQARHGPKYSAEEQEAAEREFEPKTKILCLRLRRITDDDRQILNVCHKFRCEAFHRGKLRRGILEQAARLLYITVVDLTLKLPAPSLGLPGGEPKSDEAKFLERYCLKDAYSLLTEEGRRRLADRLLAGVDFDGAAFASMLSTDLLERIDHMLGALEDLGETSDPSKIDRNLQYTQFWQDRGASLLARGIFEPDLEAAYRQWQSEGRAKYTLHKISRWRREAEAIGRCTKVARALDHYWSVEKRLRPLEEDVYEAVYRRDEEINAQIHSR